MKYFAPQNVKVSLRDGMGKYIPSVKTYGFATSPCNKGRLFGGFVQILRIIFPQAFYVLGEIDGFRAFRKQYERRQYRVYGKRVM